MARDKLTRKQERVVEVAANPNIKTITDVAKMAGVSRPTVYKTLQSDIAKQAIDVKRKEYLTALKAASEGADAGFAWLNGYLNKLIKKAQTDRVEDEDLRQVLTLTAAMWKAKIDGVQHGLSTEESDDATDEEMYRAGDMIARAYNLGNEFDGDINRRAEIIEHFLDTGEVIDPRHTTVDAEVIEQAEPSTALEVAGEN